MNPATYSELGAANTSRGVPCCSMRPLRMIASRSPNASASLWSWVTYTAVNPRRWCSSASSLRTCSRSRASRLLSGSSNRISAGRATSPRASATRCCWPPLSWLGYAVEQLAAVDRGGDVLDPAVLQATPLVAGLQRVGDVLADRHVRPQRVRLEDHPDAALVGWQVELRGAVEDPLVAERDDAVVGALQPGQAPQRRRLAAPTRARAARGTRPGRSPATGRRRRPSAASPRSAWSIR